MLILSLTYISSPEQADTQMQPHMDWVNAGYDKGWFLASGRKVPRTGGVIFAKGDRAEIEAYCMDDPFVIHNIATYEITELALTRTIPSVEGLK